LSPEHRQEVLAAGRQVTLRRDSRISSPDEPIDFIYFPLTAVVAMLMQTADGKTVEIGVIGNEGLVGLCVFWGVPIAAHLAITVVEGDALQVPAARLAALLDSPEAHLHDVLLRYTHALVAHNSQTAACNRLHPVDGRLARWLLVSNDRSGISEFPVTQDFLARLLGVRRVSITEAAGRLAQLGVIRYDRGRVTIVDRIGLERCTCECYEIVRQAFARYLNALEPHRQRQAAMTSENWIRVEGG
jgi:CRP-like cAMP-binding protein